MKKFIVKIDKKFNSNGTVKVGNEYVTIVPNKEYSFDDRPVNPTLNVKILEVEIPEPKEEKKSKEHHSSDEVSKE